MYLFFVVVVVVLVCLFVCVCVCVFESTSGKLITNTREYRSFSSGSLDHAEKSFPVTFFIKKNSNSLLLKLYYPLLSKINQYIYI